MASSELDSFGFRNPDTAIRLKRVMAQIATQETGALLPNQNVARCLSVNLANLKSDVWIPGDPEPITVNLLPGTIPNDIGDNTLFSQQSGNSVKGQGSLVIIEPINGKTYITRVLSGGQFAYDLGAAGFSHKILNTSHVIPEQWDHTPEVSGTFGKSFSFFLPSNQDVTRVGPFVATGNGTTLDGVMKIHVSRGYDISSYEFTVADRQLLDTNTGAVTWMRAMPLKTGRIGTDSELAVDMGILPTSYRDPSGYELWLRFVELSPSDDIDFTYVNVEAFGPIINIGDPTSGRLLVMDYTGAPEQIAGYLGFHDSNHGMRNRLDEASATDTPYYNGTGWSAGAYDDQSTSLAQHLLPLWSCTGLFQWNGARVKWTNDIIFSGIGPSHYGLYKGRLNVPMVPSGTKIPLYPAQWTGAISSVTVLSDANGIPLEEGDTLYFGIPPGMGNGETDGTTNWHKLKWMFFIVDSESYTALDFNYKLPQWAIPIARRGIAGEIPEFRLTSPQVDVIDSTRRVISIPMTAAVTGLAASTTLVTHTLPSFTFKNGAAYRVKAHVQVRLPTANANALVQGFLRKGTTTAGTTYADFQRTSITTATLTAQTFSYATQEQIISNTTGADITTQTVFCTFCSATFDQAASATSKSWAEIEYIGPAAKYPEAGAIT